MSVSSVSAHSCDRKIYFEALLIYFRLLLRNISERHVLGRAVAQAVSRWRSLVSPPQRPGFASRYLVEFVMDKAGLGQFSSEYFDFP
jgi:hypothetical protein